MTYVLRQCQKEAIDACRNILSEMPINKMVMGSGKSITIAEIARLTRGERNVIVTVPSVSLVHQISRTIREHARCMVGEWYADSKTVYPITVACHASLHTLPTELRPDDPFKRKTLWIADEAHKTECETVHAWADRMRPDWRVGFTATPYRARMQDRLQLWGKVAYEYTASDAYRDGHVVMPRILHPGKDGQLDDVCLDFIAAQNSPGVVNARNVEDAEAFAARVRDRGIECHAVHYQADMSSDDARAFLAQGGPRTVVYVDMLAEGFDCPQIQYLVMRRAVKSRVRFAQEVGRGLRAHEGKTECLLFDPHDLFDMLQLDFAACLGEVDEDDDAVIPTLKLQVFVEEARAKKSSDKSIPVEIFGEIRSWIRRQKLVLKIEGKIPEDIEKKSWRSDPVSQKQRDMAAALLKRIGRDRMTEEYQIAFAAAYMAMWDPKMKKGDVADMITILKYEARNVR